MKRGIMGTIFKAGMKVSYTDRDIAVPAILMNVDGDTAELVSLYAIGTDARERLYDIEDSYEYQRQYTDDQIAAGERHNDLRAARLDYCKGYERKLMPRTKIEVFVFEITPAEMQSVRR